LTTGLITHRKQTRAKTEIKYTTDSATSVQVSTGMGDRAHVRFPVADIYFGM